MSEHKVFGRLCEHRKGLMLREEVSKRIFVEHLLARECQEFAQLYDDKVVFTCVAEFVLEVLDEKLDLVFRNNASPVVIDELEEFPCFFGRRAIHGDQMIAVLHQPLLSREVQPVFLFFHRCLS